MVKKRLVNKLLLLFCTYVAEIIRAEPRREEAAKKEEERGGGQL